MAKSKFGPLVADVRADTSDFRKKMDDAARKSETFAQKSSRGFKKVGKALTGAKAAFAAFGAAIGAAALIRSADAVISKLDKIGKTADKLGIGVERLQELQFAAQQTGVSTETMNMAMQRFTRRVAEAQQGQGELKDTLKQYGIALTDNNGIMRSSEDIFNDYVNVIGTASSESEALRLAFKGFDSEGAALVNTFRDGTEGLDDFATKAREAGAIIGEDLVRGAEEAREEIDLMRTQLGAEFAKIIAQNTDNIINLTRSIMDFVNTTLNGIGRMRSAWMDWKDEVDDTSNVQQVQDHLIELNEELDRAFKLMNSENKGTQEWLDAAEAVRALKKEISDASELRAKLLYGDPKKPTTKPTEGEETGGGGGVPTIDEMKEKEKALAEARKEQEEARKARLKEINKLFEDSFKLLDETIAKDDEALQGYIDMIDPIAEHKKQLIEIDELMRKYPEHVGALSEAYKQVAEDAAEVVVANQEIGESGKTMRETTAEWGLAFNSALEDSIVNGGNLSDVFDGLIQDLIRATIRTMILKPLLDSLGASGGVVGMIFGGPKAGGGVIQPNVGTLVGERGPELIVPNAPSRVLNNHTLQAAGGVGGAGGGNITVEIVNRGTPQEAQTSTSTMNAQGAVISIVTDDIRRNGPIATGMQQSFGLRRQA